MATKRRHRRSPRGAVLLEVIVALTVLATIAGTAAWHTQEWIRAVERTHAEENDVRDAQRLITAVSLWPLEDLDKHLGVSMQGRWRLHVRRDGRTLYEIFVVDSLSGVAALRTTVFRDPSEGQ